MAWPGTTAPPVLSPQRVSPTVCCIWPTSGQEHVTSGCSLLAHDKQPPASFRTILRPSTSYFLRYDLHKVRFRNSLRTRVAVGFRTIRFTSRKFQPRGFTPCHRMLKHTSYLRTSLFTHTTTPLRNGLKHFVNATKLAQFNFFFQNPAITRRSTCCNIQARTICPNPVQFSAPIIPLNITNRLVCITEMHCVLCEVRTDMNVSSLRCNTLKPSGHYMYRTVVTTRTASLTFNSSTFCPHSVFMCFVWISEQTAIISLYSIN
jgi:hypothetical protein